MLMHTINIKLRAVGADRLTDIIPLYRCSGIEIVYLSQINFAPNMKISIS